MAAISGSTSNVVYGNASSNGPYSMVITCSATKQIEVQLHMKKPFLNADTEDDFKSSKTSAHFDEFSLKLAP